MTGRHCLYAIAVVFLTAGSTSGQRIDEADRFVKLGTRVAPLPPGEGGQLLVSAPAELCADASHVLEVRFIPRPPVIGPIARLLAGPSRCRWTFDGVQAGEYNAVIQVHEDGRIVATGEGHVSRGATTEMTLQAVQVEIEGRLTIEGFTFESFPLASDLRVVFGFQGFPVHEWIASPDATGAYRLKIGGVEADRRVCAQIRRARRMNSVFPWKCQTFAPGLQRFDLENLPIPPGVLRIDVPAVPDAASDAVVRLTVSAEGRSGYDWYTSVFVRRGFGGDFIAHLNHKYRVDLTPHGGSDVLASAQVTLTSDQPVADIKLAAKVVR